MKHLRPLLALLMCGLGGMAGRLDAADAKPPLCLVLFRLVVDADAKLKEVQTVNGIELLAGSKSQLSVELSQEYMANVRKQAEALDLSSAVEEGSTMTSFIHVPTPAGSAVPRISFAALDGAMNTTGNLHLLGRNGQMSQFVKNLGGATLSVMYYALPELPKETPAQREAIIEAEIQRSAANVRNAEILSKKNLSTDGQTIVEMTMKSARSKALTIRARYLSNEEQMIALVAITPESMPAGDKESLERMFEAFRYK